MATIRLLPPHDLPLKGRKHAKAAKKVLDIPDVQAEVLCDNGWRAIGMVGTTQERPADGLPATVPCYIDTTLNKPIFWDGSTWRDCLGNIV